MYRRRYAAALGGLLLLASGCGGSGTEKAAAPKVAGKTGPLLLEAAAGKPVERRQVVYTGDAVVKVSSIRKATEAAARIASDAGGFVFSQATDQHETKLTVKVPSDRFDGTVAAIVRLGKELRRNLKAQDVTAEVVDVEGRLKTAQASADRLRGLLAEAKTPADVVAIESELAKRETDIETLQGRLRVLNDQVALATLTVRLTERNDLEVTNLPGFLGGLRSGIVAVINIGQVLLVVLGFLVPFVPIAALLIWGWRRFRRRHPRPPRRSTTAPVWPPQPPQAAGAAVPPQQMPAPPSAEQ